MEHVILLSSISQGAIENKKTSTILNLWFKKLEHFEDFMSVLKNTVGQTHLMN